MLKYEKTASFVCKMLMPTSPISENMLDNTPYRNYELSGLHLVNYLDVGNFCDKRTEKTVDEICVQDFPIPTIQANLYR